MTLASAMSLEPSIRLEAPLLLRLKERIVVIHAVDGEQVGSTRHAAGGEIAVAAIACS